MKTHNRLPLLVRLFAAISIAATFSLGMVLPAAAATDSPSTQSQDSKKTKKQKVTTKTVTKTESINFTTKKQNDATLASGKTKVLQQGKKGSKKVTYKVTYVNGKQTKKQVVSTKVTKKPVTKVIAIGTYVAPAPTPEPAIVEPEPAPETSAPAASSNCDPNYTPCIPYYAGNTLNCPDIGVMVQVVGTDHNRFDADHDGYGCEFYR